MSLCVVHHRVRDFDSWKPVFDEHESSRREHGAKHHWVYRTVDDPNDVVVAVEFRSENDAREFVQDPSLRQAMEKAGVEGEPQIQFRELVEDVGY
jgi:heme-degrading monooxygenase HmoA